MRYQSYRDVPSTEDKHQRHPQFMFLFLEYNSITSLPYIVSIQLVQYDLLVSFSVQSTRTASTTKPDPNSFIRALIGNRQNLRPHDQSRLLGSQQHHPLLLRRLLRLRLQPPHPNPRPSTDQACSCTQAPGTTAGRRAATTQSPTIGS